MTWKYLYSEPFKTRYVLSAYFLKECEEIIEIGGFKTPITDFVGGKKTIVVDPLIEPIHTETSQHLAITFDNYGVLMLGLDVIMPEEGWTKLYKLISGSSITVLETPLDYAPSLVQLNSILRNTNKKTKISFMLDLTGNNFGDMTDSYPPFCRRQMHVLQ